MKNSQKFSPPAIGGSSLLAIFALLTLCIFTLLSLSTVLAEKRLSEAAADGTVRYYAADLQAEETLAKLRSGEITAGHARAVLSLKSEKKQLEAAQKIAALGLSVRQAELLCRNLSQEKQPEPPKAPLAIDYVAECEKSLSRVLGRGVKIVNGKRKGKFELEFYGQEDLQVLLEALMTLKGAKNHE